MSLPIWITTSGSVGAILIQRNFQKQLIAENATDFSLLSGELPPGLSLTSSGLIYGVPNIDNIVANKSIYIYSFLIRATNNQGFIDRAFSITLLFQILIPSNFNQNNLRYNTNTLQYFISKGQVITNQNIYWRLGDGALPDNVSLTPNGTIVSTFTQNIKPLRQEEFLNRENITDNTTNTWNAWISNFLSDNKEYDFHFTVYLGSPSTATQQSFSIRLIYTKIDPLEYWFVDNNINFDTNQYYFFLTTTEQNFINWESNSNLGEIVNGAVSELLINAKSNQKSNLIYYFKPSFASALPQGMTLLNNGLLSGRLGFNSTVNNSDTNYQLTVRAQTSDSFNYSEKTFNLTVKHIHNKPYNNIWIRSFPSIKDRTNLNNIINDEILFPSDIIYRPEDPWFGKANIPVRFLFAPGINLKTQEEYALAVQENHYRKSLSFSEVKTAVCLNQDLSIRYEVVYLQMQDNLSIFNNRLNVFQGLPDIIDIREFVSNYYLKDGTAYYLFKPNGLSNMTNQLSLKIGFYNTGIIPNWMLSFQPIDNDALKLRAPLGFIPAVVLAYTLPGGSNLIKYRLNRKKINFNNYHFEFDRYELDYSQSFIYDSSNENYKTFSETVFDLDTTQFDSGVTNFIETNGVPINGGTGSRYGDKYIKFPNVGAFN